MLARKCVKNSKRPILGFKNIPVPIAPIINKGPEEFVNAINLSASSLVHKFILYKSLDSFAPSG